VQLALARLHCVSPSERNFKGRTIQGEWAMKELTWEYVLCAGTAQKIKFVYYLRAFIFKMVL
jgi:hypothetical protein